MDNSNFEKRKICKKYLVFEYEFTSFLEKAVYLIHV